VVEAVSVEAVVPGDAPGEPAPRTARASAGAANRAHTPAAPGTTRPGGARGPAAGAIDGPAIIAERNATTVVEPGWRAS
jgi:5-oxoprolinase (ATP-hydrolysing)